MQSGRCISGNSLSAATPAGVKTPNQMPARLPTLTSALFDEQRNRQGKAQTQACRAARRPDTTACVQTAAPSFNAGQPSAMKPLPRACDTVRRASRSVLASWVSTPLATRARGSPGALSQSELSGLPADGCSQFLSVGFFANANHLPANDPWQITRRSCEWRRHVSVGRRLAPSYCCWVVAVTRDRARLAWCTAISRGLPHRCPRRARQTVATSALRFLPGSPSNREGVRCARL